MGPDTPHTAPLLGWTEVVSILGGIDTMAGERDVSARRKSAHAVAPPGHGRRNPMVKG